MKKCGACGLPLGPNACHRQRYCDDKCKYRARANREGRPSRKSLDERLWPRIAADGDCWVWMGGRTAAGYGEIRIGHTMRLVHRVVWEYMRGEIPSGLEMDHLCRNRPCCNPDHLDPVTTSENQLRRYDHARANFLVTRDKPSTWEEWSP